MPETDADPWDELPHYRIGRGLLCQIPRPRCGPSDCYRRKAEFRRSGERYGRTTECRPAKVAEFR